jgi:glutathione S-transferase
MLRLYGFPVSNYTNMVHLALLEKGLPFEYVLTYPDQDKTFLDRSARGKVPVLETPHGCISETSVILDYLEDCGEGTPLLPSDSFARAEARLLSKMIELYIELPARACFGEAIFGLSTPDAIKEKSREELVNGFAALQRRAKFAPYVAGDTFTVADIMFLYSADLAALVGRNLWGLDLLGTLPGAQDLLQRLGTNPHVQSLAAARDAGIAAFIATVRARYGRK